MGAVNNMIAAFSEDQAIRLTGITRSQLRYWDRTSFFSPSYTDGSFSDAFGRVYSFRDIVALRVLSVLRNQYAVSVQHLRDVKERLSQHVSSKDDLWTGVRLYVLNRKVYWVGPNDSLPSNVVSGQFVVPTIEFDNVVNSTKVDARELWKRSSDAVGRIESSKKALPLISGTRISVRAIQRFSEAGYSVDQILKEYPDLSREDVAAALAYKLAA